MSYDTASGAGLNGGTAYRYGPQDRMDEEMYF
jgi:hypothetical protein